MNSAVADMHAVTPHCIARRRRGRTAFISASTAMWTFARYTAAPPMNVNAIIMITAAGSGQPTGLFIA